MKGIVFVKVIMDDGTTVNLTGEIALADRSLIAVGHVSAPGEFTDDHGDLLRSAFACLAKLDYKESLVRVADDQQGGAVN